MYIYIYSCSFFFLFLFSYLNYLIFVQQHCLLVSCLRCDCRLCLSCSFSSTTIIYFIATNKYIFTDFGSSSHWVHGVLGSFATIPITGTGINPARSLGAAIIYNKGHAWDDQVSIHIFFLNK